MAFENFPASLQLLFQQNMLARRYEGKLKGKNVYRKTAFRLGVPTRSGEAIIYSREGAISPQLDDIVPSSNVGLDNGMTGIPGVGTNGAAYPFEQFSVSIGMQQYYIDLNLIQNKEVIADLFKSHVDRLSENAALSLDLRVAATAFNAYMSGQSYITGAETSGNATVHLDNVVGLDAAFATATFNGSTFPTGAPLAVSSSNPLSAALTYASGTDVGQTFSVSIIGCTYDDGGAFGSAIPGPGTGNVSKGATLRIGRSGTVTLAAVPSQLGAKGDVLVAADAPQMFRPNAKNSVDALTAGDLIGAQLIINAVNELRANGVGHPAGMDTFPCYIDPLVDAQFFTDEQYQIMSQGSVASPDFKDARINRNFGVTFIPTTNSPSFKNTQGVPIRHVLIVGEQYVQDAPFLGTEEAIRSMPDMAIQKFDLVDGIVFVNRMPLDRAGQVLSMGWYYIGGYVAPTDATINSTVIPSASSARYKRAAVIQVAASR